ncbi:acidPPc [Nesidiocoris tenuis]|uniref:AcidPPc n=1 Tax=Nesidiocoris tenuis TaxID=355587 RepID=A0ABN7AD99_9HEMI|nr:acidPPc [Nesidiocoris tenuis]
METAWSWSGRLLYAFFSLAAILIVSVCEFVPLFRPQGFHCNDPDLSHKYIGETITNAALLIAAFVLPLFILVPCEHWGRCGSNAKWLKRSLIWYKDFVSGLLILLTIVAITKVLVGEPRPHFFDSCRPREALNCSTGSFVYNFHCTTSKARHFQDASKSFPSGHSAVAFYFFLFMSWYLQKNLKRLPSIVLLWMQTGLFLTACFVALSRITDHRHHWWDVLFGTVIGCAMAVCSVLTFSRSFKTLDPDVSTHSFDNKGGGRPLTFLGNENNTMQWFLNKTSAFADTNDGSHIITP